MPPLIKFHESDVRLSVGLVTRNRPESLHRALASLRRQSVQPVEVVLSDDSEDSFKAEVRRIATSFDCRYIDGPRRGLYANRNNVALACTGTHIRTMDDDHEFPDGHLDATLGAVQSDPNSIWIVGEYQPIQVQPGCPPACPGQLTARGAAETPDDPQNCWAIADGATTYPRQVFELGLRYVEEFPFGSSFLEFGSRLYWLGYRIRFLPHTYVIHNCIHGRSYMDDETDLAASVFAMFCQVGIYQPSVRNKVRCIYQLGLHCLLRTRLAIAAVPRSWRVYRNHAARVRAAADEWKREVSFLGRPSQFSL